MDNMFNVSAISKEKAGDTTSTKLNYTHIMAIFGWDADRPKPLCNWLKIG